MPTSVDSPLIAAARRRLSAAVAGDLEGVATADADLADALAARRLAGADPGASVEEVEVVALLRLADLHLAAQRDEVREALEGTAARRRAGRAYAASGRVS